LKISPAARAARSGSDTKVGRALGVLNG
jgi:hypothetical protein